MKIPCYHRVSGANDKLKIFTKAVEEKGLTLSEAAFMGDDLNDLHVLKAAGLSVAVRDAHPSVRRSVDLVLSSRGGQHAIREFIEIVFLAQGKDPATLVEEHNRHA